MEEKLNLDGKKEELSKKIELSCGFGELSTILNDSEGDKMRKANQELIRRESVGSQLHTIQDRENDSGRRFRKMLGIGVHFRNSRKPT